VSQILPLVNNRPASLYSMELARGNIPGHRAFNLFGISGTINASSEELLAPLDEAYVPPSTLESFRVRAGGNISDTSIGPGCRQIAITFIDENFNEVTEFLTLNGASASASTSSPGYRVNALSIQSVGTINGSNIGDIVIENETSNQVVSSISAGAGLSEWGILTVPTGYKYIPIRVLSVASSTRPVSVFIDIGFGPQLFSAPFGPTLRYVNSPDFLNSFEEAYDSGVALNGPLDLKIMAIAGSGNSVTVSSRLQGVIVKI